MDTARIVAFATRLIQANGEACTWNKRAPKAPATNPWRDVRAGATPSFPVRIAWFTPRDLGRGREWFLAAILGTELPAGTEIGLLAGGQTFTPEATDTIVRGDGKAYEIDNMELLAPNGTPLLYYVRIAR